MRRKSSKGARIIVGGLCLASLVWLGSHYIKPSKKINHNEVKQETSVSYNKWGIDYLLNQLKEEIRKDPYEKKSYLDSMLNFSIGMKEENKLGYKPKTVEQLFDIVKRELGASQDMRYVEMLWLQFPEERKNEIVKKYFEALPYQRKWDILKPVLGYKLKEGGKQVIDDFKAILGDMKKGDYGKRDVQNQSANLNENTKESLQVLKKYLLGDN